MAGEETRRDAHAPADHDHGGDHDYDVVVVGSGFGGSVAALRLTEKGYRVAVLEAGRRFARSELPRNSWDLRRYLWAPRLRLYGIQRIHLLRNVMILAGAGVGGGSLNYANVLYKPPAAFFEDRQWRDITDWRAELEPYYEQARRMLGARLNPTMTPADTHLREAAERMGVGDTFHLAPVGVFFDDGRDAREDAADAIEPRGTATAHDADSAPGATRSGSRGAVDVPDPYFGGAGPTRRGCLECGECMTGCRHGAKNTLNENYLHLAERAGAEVHPLTTVTEVAPDGDGFVVTAVPTDASRRRRRRRQRTLRARHVVLAAGAYGTQTLLHRMRDTGTLPGISDRLGTLARTNSEALVGARTNPRRYRARRRALSKDAGPGTGAGAGPDFTRGVAITSSIHPDEHTHIQPVRYGRGSNSMGLLSIKQYRQGLPRLLAYALTTVRHPLLFLVSLSNRRWSERTLIALTMQTHDNSVTTFRRRRWPGRGLLTSRQGHGAPNPVHLPEAAETARHLADSIGGFAGTNVGELVGTPLTAHFIGGCPIGADPKHGVVDPYHRLYGHPGISVVDGSAISANLGVNPSLTITAQAERAFALWPNRGETDQRPPQDGADSAYRRLPPVTPRAPAVPPGAFAALRW